jgi:hypothetical protein
MVSVDKYFSDDTLSDKISAFIGKNGEVDANGNISVDANEKTTANAISGTVAAGGTAVGGSVLVGTFNATTESYVDSLVSSDANVGISAKNEISTGDNGYQAIAGSAGVVGIGASVSYLDITGKVAAYLGSDATLSAGGNLDVNAELSVNSNPKTSSATVGGGAVGISSARTVISGEAFAGMLDGAKLEKANNANVKAHLTGKTNVYSVASSGGLAAITANVAKVDVTAKVTSEIGTGCTVSGVKSFKVKALSDIATYVRADGLNVGGVAVGGSNALLNLDGDVLANVKKDAVITVGSFDLAALYNVNESLKDITANKQFADVFTGASGMASAIENVATVTVRKVLSHSLAAHSPQTLQTLLPRATTYPRQTLQISPCSAEFHSVLHFLT